LFKQNKNKLNNPINTKFNIKDLENLSGVKAHTIRIWEKRYKILAPKRTDTNIRYYDGEDLQRILNVSLLNNNGVKISKIADLTDDALLSAVRNLIIQNDKYDHAINDFKLSMMNFDHRLFNKTYNQLLVKSSFREIFLKIFVQLLNDIGLLWLSNTISPAHEHFLSNLIQQKLQLQIEKVQALDIVDKDKLFVLFLPENEIHELGLMFVHLNLLLNGYNSIYLGQSIPLESLKDFHPLFDNITFISYFTVMPANEDLPIYLRKVNEEVLRYEKDLFLVLGKKINEIDSVDYDNIKFYPSIDSLLEFV
jgi:MerR family transcriptional regulator, light-induced transcriptional regulator